MDKAHLIPAAQRDGLRLHGHGVGFRPQAHLGEPEAAMLPDKVGVCDAVLLELDYVCRVGVAVAVIVDHALVFLVVLLLIDKAHSEAVHFLEHQRLLRLKIPGVPLGEHVHNGSVGVIVDDAMAIQESVGTAARREDVMHHLAGIRLRGEERVVPPAHLFTPCIEIFTGGDVEVAPRARLRYVSARHHPHEERCRIRCLRPRPAVTVRDGSKTAALDVELVNVSVELFRSLQAELNKCHGMPGVPDHCRLSSEALESGPGEGVSRRLSGALGVRVGRHSP